VIYDQQKQSMIKMM